MRAARGAVEGRMFCRDVVERTVDRIDREETSSNDRTNLRRVFTSGRWILDP